MEYYLNHYGQVVRYNKADMTAEVYGDGGWHETTYWAHIIAWGETGVCEMTEELAQQIISRE